MADAQTLADTPVATLAREVDRQWEHWQTIMATGDPDRIAMATRELTTAVHSHAFAVGCQWERDRADALYDPDNPYA